MEYGATSSNTERQTDRQSQLTKVLLNIYWLRKSEQEKGGSSKEFCGSLLPDINPFSDLERGRWVPGKKVNGGQVMS